MGADLTGFGRTGFVGWGGGITGAEIVELTFGVGPVDECNLAIPAYDAEKNKIEFFDLLIYLINLLPSVVVCLVCCWFSWVVSCCRV